MSKQRREVQNLILMLSSAVFVAFIVVVGLVYYFGSSGTYLLRDILISPDALKGISFSDFDPETGGRSPFIFNKIEFIRAESSGREWGRYAVSKQSYEEFYNLVSHERSIPHISDEMIEQFASIVPSTLTIFVQARDNKGTREDGFIFQRVEFLDQEDVFRVQMRDSKDTWIYFSYPGIYNKVVELFAPLLYPNNLKNREFGKADAWNLIQQKGVEAAQLKQVERYRRDQIRDVRRSQKPIFHIVWV